MNRRNYGDSLCKLVLLEILSRKPIGFRRLVVHIYLSAFCDVDKMRYSDGRLQKPQKMGFAVICQDNEGSIIKDKTKVVVLD